MGMRLTVWACAGAMALATLAATAARAGAQTTTTTVTPATAYQMAPTHSGVTPDVVAASPAKRWAVTFPGAVSYPLVTGDRVFVTAVNASGTGTSLYALSTSTGARLWGPIPLYGTYAWSGLAFDAGRVFTVNDTGVMQAFSALNGAPLWTLQLPYQYMFTSPPTASHGYVYTGGAGSGGTLYAVSESTGALVWAAPVMNGDDSSPAVSSSGVYVAYACGQTYDFNPTSGALIWHRATPCEGGGGKTPVLANGRLYVRDSSYPGVLNATTGALVAPFASSGPAPAVDAGQVYDQQGGTLTATSVSTAAVAWSFRGDGTLSSAPIKAGSTVYVGGTSGRLYGLAYTTGAVTWSTNVGASILPPDEQNVRVLTGMAAAGGNLVVAASNELIDYR